MSKHVATADNGNVSQHFQIKNIRFRRVGFFYTQTLAAIFKEEGQNVR